MPDEFTAAELAHIQRTASLAQVGRVNNSVEDMCRQVRYSTPTRKFWSCARHMVLRLCAQVRNLERERDELAARVAELEARESVGN